MYYLTPTGLRPLSPSDDVKVAMGFLGVYRRIRCGGSKTEALENSYCVRLGDWYTNTRKRR